MKHGIIATLTLALVSLSAQAEDPVNTVVSVKRFMGRRLADLPGPRALPLLGNLLCPSA